MKSITLTAATLVASLALAGHATARDQIQIAGSSTVLPYAKIVAENFGETYPNFKTPVVESGGSSAGLKEFCKGVDLNTIDIANASRKIKDSEVKVCAENGVTEIQEIRIGYDGIVFATDINGPDFAISPKDIYLALAAKVPSKGKMVDNTYTKWSDVNSKFPSWDITAYIPGEKHGTREVFETKLLEAGCKATGAYDLYMSAGMDKKAAEKACYAVRKDGRAVDIDGDYTETLARIDANKQGMGVFGLAFYENNTDKLKVATVDGIVPSTESIASGKYPVSRPLYFYVKKKHLGAIPGLKEYVEYFISDAMVGPDSPLAEYGLVAAPANERKAVRADFKAGKTL
ncbi:PstS family phosphate ABC transporter substrate-binding protein [Gynuella sunshinyii]|uniref:ABC-type phosphate transport system, periplasmic component n=1 Tax=Gynuella sunshinyii YC6258 TaxID=1445510 RepID=A0A0C5VDD3_9GAMM|nr:substrate-binding domain-containing protein [Gynuella sunshinyii]AJQ92226.1 ABC-type phosphate transport system, periplasmic component [Gynuella sunshinyii YC6258]